MSDNSSFASTDTNSTPKLLTKKELCVMYGLINSQGRCNYVALYNHVLTDDVIMKIGGRPETIRCRGKRMFSAVETVKLKRALMLDI
jgi:hypothetical protein